jgi:hypothetical protein
LFTADNISSPVQISDPASNGDSPDKDQRDGTQSQNEESENVYQSRQPTDARSTAENANVPDELKA